MAVSTIGARAGPTTGALVTMFVVVSRTGATAGPIAVGVVTVLVRESAAGEAEPEPVANAGSICGPLTVEPEPTLVLPAEGGDEDPPEPPAIGVGGAAICCGIAVGGGTVGTTTLVGSILGTAVGAATTSVGRGEVCPITVGTAWETCVTTVGAVGSNPWAATP
jgi:hypothetical protein